jgi:hypothetical protein
MAKTGFDAATAGAGTASKKKKIKKNLHFTPRNGILYNN